MVTYGHMETDRILYKRDYYTKFTDKISRSRLEECDEYLATTYMKMNLPQVFQRLGEAEFFEVRIEHTKDQKMYAILRITREDIYNIIDYYESDVVSG